MKYRFYTDKSKDLYLEFTEEEFEELGTINLEMIGGDIYKSKVINVEGINNSTFVIIAPIKDFQKIED